jgi:hypothetical protein
MKLRSFTAPAVAAAVLLLADSCATTSGPAADGAKPAGRGGSGRAMDTRVAERVSESRLSNDQKAEGDAVLGTLIWNELKVAPPAFDEIGLSSVMDSLVGHWKGELNFLGGQPFQLIIRRDGTWYFSNSKGGGGGEWVLRPRRVELWEPQLAELDFAVGSISNSWHLITLHTTGGTAILKRQSN